MKTRIASVLLAVAIATTALAGVTTVFNGVSAASGSSGEIDTSGGYSLNVQVCGASFAGTISVKQGAASGKLTETKALSLSAYPGCSEYLHVQKGPFGTVSEGGPV